MYKKLPMLQAGIFDMFRAGASGQPPVQQPNGNPNPAPNPNANPNDPGQNPQQVTQNTPKQQGQPTGDDTNKSPLADFAKLWENDPVKDGQPVEPNWDEASSLVPEVKIDPKKLVEAAKRIDFSKAIDPALVQKALKEGDVGAFNSIINSVLQASFANMAMASSRISENMSRSMAQKILDGALPHHLRKHAVSSKVAEDNPIFNDPAVAPMLSMLEGQMRVKYPKASPAEISSKAKQMLTAMSTVINPGSGTPNSGGKGGGKKNTQEDINWAEFAGIETPQQQ